MAIDLGQFLKEVKSATTWGEAQRGISLMLEHIQDSVNNGFEQLGVTTNGKTAPPDPPEKLDVIANNGTVQVQITHNAPINKNIVYTVEASTDPAFLQSHQIGQSSSRSHFKPLPAMDDNGDPLKWHFRATAQYPGSDASAHVYFGDRYSPTPVDVGGTAQFTPLASTGGGTSPPNGQLAGQGLGSDFKRPLLGPKRGVSL